MTLETDSGGNGAAVNVQEGGEPQSQRTLLRRAVDFYWKQEFLILVVLAIPLARAYPQLGAVYLKPKITATWIAVVLIFLLSGLSLRVSDLRKALLNMRFNLLVLGFNFGVVSAIVFGVSRALLTAGIVSRDIADGMAICGSLPVTVNMAIVFAEVAGSDVAAAVFTTAVSNMSGIFISPLLIVGYLGGTYVSLYEVFYKLALRVLVPLMAGQILQTFVVVSDFVKNNKPGFKRAQQYLLIYIIYTIFCKAFSDSTTNSISDILLLVLFQFLLMVSVLTMAWYTLKVLYPNKPKLRVTGLFGFTHKTISIGVPLIAALYEGSPKIGIYTLPILIWHPMQLVVGTLLMPRLQAFIKSEHERLGTTEDVGGVVSPVDDADIVKATEQERIAATEHDKLSSREESPDDRV